MDVTQHFKNHFEIVNCRTQETKEDCFKLRYQAYCVEQGYVLDTASEIGMEIDEYDGRAVHVLIRHRNCQVSVATARLVLAHPHSPDEKFPLEKYDVLRRIDRDREWKVARQNLAEISRFAVSKDFRKRVDEHEKLHGITPHIFEIPHSGRRQSADITLGLFQAVVKLSHEFNITHWYAMMEPSLIKLLGRSGIHFVGVGPLVQLYGTRQPCIAVVEEVLAGIYYFRQENWDFITDYGRYYGKDYLGKYEDAVALNAEVSV